MYKVTCPDFEKNYMVQSKNCFSYVGESTEMVRKNNSKKLVEPESLREPEGNKVNQATDST